jgi:pilus assembly protein CpaE
MTTNPALQEAGATSPEPAPVITMIPHINIAAFCDDENTARVMRAAAADRRMASAHMDVQMGGMAAALQVFSATRTPDVLLVESQQKREGLLAELATLAPVCDPSSKVMVIGHVNDVILYRELMREGISEYLVAPLHQLQIIESISNLFRDPKAAPVGRVLAFVGAKGGVGSSMIAHHVAWLISRDFAIDAVITDLDLAFGTAGLNFNLDTPQGIVEALGASDRIDQVLIDRLLTKCGDRLSLLASAGSVERDVTVEPRALQTILDAVRASVPLVVVDVPNFWTPWSKLTLTQADEVIITATPELASLRNAKNLIDFLKAARPNDRPPHLVLNQVGVVKRPEIPVADFARGVGVEPTLIVPYDPKTFGTASSNGQMIFDVAPKSKAADALTKLARTLSGREPPQARSGKFSLGPLMKSIVGLRTR